jgi:RimJ/RimL family protein N-acetyltransferase
MIRVESPFPAYAIPRMWDWMRAFGAWRVTDDYGPQDREGFIQHWEQLLDTEGVETFGVYRDAELGGAVYVQTVTPHLATAHVLFKKTFFGFDTTVPAARQVFDQVFRTGVGRIESYAFEDNSWILGMARKLGAVKEGTLRQRTLRKGRLIDLHVLGLLKDDFYKRIEDEKQCHLSPSAPHLQELPPLPAGSGIEHPPQGAPADASAS